MYEVRNTRLNEISVLKTFPESSSTVQKSLNVFIKYA